VELKVEDLPPDQAPEHVMMAALTDQAAAAGGGGSGAEVMGGGSVTGSQGGDAPLPRTHSTLHQLMGAHTPEGRDHQLQQQTSRLSEMDASGVNDGASDATAYTADDGEGRPSMSCPLPSFLRRNSGDGSVGSAPLYQMQGAGGTPVEGQGPEARWYSSSPTSMRGSMDIPDMTGDDDQDGTWPGNDRHWGEPNNSGSSSGFTRLGIHSLPGNTEGGRSSGGQTPELPPDSPALQVQGGEGAHSAGRRVRISVRDTGIGIARECVCASHWQSRQFILIEHQDAVLRFMYAIACIHPWHPMRNDALLLLHALLPPAAELLGRLFESFRQGTETMSRRWVETACLSTMHT
jgi:hypothetical protein